MEYTVKDRFLRYVQIDTQADPTSSTFPSSKKQWDLTNLLMKELAEMNVEASTNEAGYIYASVPSNSDKPLPKVFFCAHIDTAPDCSGTNVKPIVIQNYQGEDIILPDDTSQVISPTKYPALLDKIGNEIITASGLTLLGSDDKSGIAVIMDAVFQMIQNPNLPHGEVKILFTTDEEIGKGVANVDLKKLDADFGYTLDSGDLGCFEDENFSADRLSIHITGVSAHPGYAKGKMENAIKIAGAIIDRLPKLTLSPETSSEMDGFIHPNKCVAHLETAQIDFILRDFKTENLKEYADLLDRTCNEVMELFPGSSYKIEQKAQYRNMKDVLEKHSYVSDIAIKAMKNVNIPVKQGAIRGGTDGAILSHMGLPCPNLFAGEQAIHSKHEWVSVQDMHKSVDTILEICRLVTTEEFRQ
ncbi:MAG: peptidase T [Saprospiraceae bacterium]|nr:peptidase T [Saprospiraceae bacterium]MBK8081252.1 peptidase T [Saprospiraceae bacterium]MBK8370132.1 peptidase T [Saprospiraceae bacterium]MBK8546857.1 peptidase T [Saprospiraceae bacterium]MBK8817983.1 peptidase T [Saprospiraceae bacterium]